LFEPRPKARREIRVPTRGHEKSMAGLLVATLLLAVTLGGCHHERPQRAPGETDIVVTQVTIRGADGQELALPYGELFMLLSLRHGNVLVTNRYFSDFRVAEDRRRIASWWQNYGYFDVDVAEPKLAFAPDGKSVAVTWSVREGDRYRIASVEIRGAPREHEAALTKLVPFEIGDGIDLEEYRYGRFEMAWHLQRHGMGHANVYSRTYVDRKKKRVHWVYFVDSGPKTHIGSITLEGARRIPEDKVLWRAGAHAGEPFSLELKETIEEDLLDTGSYGSVVVKPTNAQTDRFLPGERPDTGGVMSAEQVDAGGNYVPRALDDAIDFRLVVVEAPRAQLRLRAGAEADPTRADVYGGGSLMLRDLFAPFHHLVLEGRAGYGLLLDGEEDESSGAYGEALVRTIHAGLLGRLVDARLSARYRDVLYPGFRMRELSTGPGLHTKLARNVFFELDALFRWEKEVGYGPFDATTRTDFSLPESDTSRAGQLDVSLVWDARNDRVEPTSGHFLALRTATSPGGGLGDHRFAQVAPDARVFIPLTTSSSLALRSSFGFVLGEDDSGVAPGARLFGGGAFGMRGFGRDRLSPSAPCAPPPPGGQPACDDELVGGLSLMESQLELRFLPFRKTFGLVGFVDSGAAGSGRNPFENGVSAAVGVGPRLRLWYVPIALDVSYRFLEENEPSSAKPFAPYFVFVRIGEAF